MSTMVSHGEAAAVRSHNTSSRAGCTHEDRVTVHCWDTAWWPVRSTWW